MSTDPEKTDDCAVALGQIQVFAVGELDSESVRTMRAHTVQCEACMAAYREAMNTAAALGRTGAEEREQRARERAKRRLHAEHFGPTREVVKHRRHYGLRLVLIPAFAIFLMITITGLGQAPARVELMVTDGTVKLDSRRVSVTAKPLLILPGRWLLTGTFSKARLEAGQTLIELGDRTECLLESARPLRFRLRRGLLDVEGDALVYTVLGTLKVVGGKGRVLLSGEGLSVEAESGQWTLLDRRGERTVPLGETFRVPPSLLAVQ